MILDDALRMLTELTAANRRQAKLEALREASGRLDALRVALRLANRLGFLPNRAYGELTEAADEIGRMLGGWIKHESKARDGGASARTPSREPAERPAASAKAEPQRPPRSPDRSTTAAKRRGGVRFTMRSPLIERYLAAKLAHPEAIVLVTVGAFCQAFFEDAKLLGDKLGLHVRDLAAEGEPEKIFACGIPKARLEGSLEPLRQAGWELHVE